MPDNKPYALENAINSLQSTNGQQNEQIIKQGSEGLRNDASLHKTMKEVLAEFRGSRGDNEEARRDGKKKSGGATPAPSGGATPEIEGAFEWSWFSCDTWYCVRRFCLMVLFKDGFVVSIKDPSVRSC